MSRTMTLHFLAYYFTYCQQYNLPLHTVTAENTTRINHTLYILAVKIIRQTKHLVSQNEEH